MAKSDLRFFIYNILQTHLIYVIILPLDRELNYVQKSLRLQINSDIFFLSKCRETILGCRKDLE
jgi:hypothetical protein